jgi:hypothetical protein
MGLLTWKAVVRIGIPALENTDFVRRLVTAPVPLVFELIFEIPDPCHSTRSDCIYLNDITKGKCCGVTKG